jgi:hypothetical protein
MAKNLTLQPTCTLCKRTEEIVVPIRGYEKWISGVLIQEALPQLTAGQREMLITSTCEKCFDMMFW